MGFSCVLFINSVLVIHFSSADIRVSKNDVELSYTTELRDWTRTEESRFQLYYGMHLDDCVIECGLRKHCDQLTYNAHMQLCELFKAGEIGMIQSKKSHWIHVLKQDIYVKKTPCGDECNAAEACDWKAVSPRCTYKECIDFPTLENGRILGNAHGIGSKIRFKCNYGWKPYPEPSSVCGDNGEWTPIGTCLGKIETGQPCPVKGLHESCTDLDAICELDSPGEEARPKCISKLQVNAICDEMRCSEVNNARCVQPNESSKESKCYCKPGYEFNETLEICVEFCKNYSTNGTTFDRTNQTAIIRIHHGKECVDSFDKCVDYCNTNYSAYLSINFHDKNQNKCNGISRSCVCNKLSLQQYNITDNLSSCTLYDRACEIYP